MNNIITISNLNFKYGEKTIFNNFNLHIKAGKWVSLVGPNGSGKSTLIKIILGLVPCESNVEINNLVKTKDTLYDIRKDIGVVFENPDNQFVSETVSQELAFKLENLKYSKKEIKKLIEETSTLFDIKSLLNKAPSSLSGGDKQIISLAGALINKPKILILDEALNKIEYRKKEAIYNILKNMNIDGLTIVNITHDMEETTLGNEIVILNDGKVLMHDSKEKVLLNEKLFNELGLDIPFMASLSIKLKYYELVDELIFDMKEMVNKLWK